ncbi:sigma-70 family RNA polymerase sigma factor [Actinotalea sp. C106]|uniref:sigma-70 family RNA polymerase sigma factor n=1 Tax=Actinotalea sp. C106 TaxID=2908644 RepID=UPI0027E1ACD0|nr:sigma-70 family RNA polymerase sigma factor [Actinotalea sp. C106]
MTTTEVTPPLDEATFLAQVEPLRRELLAHCYRMVGSVHDAEDLVQETYLRAWRAFHGFENRSSLRTWMYRIATNTCLTALEGRGRRPLPTGLGQPPADPTAELRESRETPWLEPAPDSLLWSTPSPDPASVVVDRDSVRLAFVAALQHLTAQQRAVLLLRDVLNWRAAEVAEALEISVAAVNSTLQRARAHVAQVAEQPTLDEADPRTRELLDSYVEAFEAYDVARIVSLLTADAVWEMPPYVEWYRGAEDIGRLIATRCPARGAGDMRAVRSSANGQPVVAIYMRDLDGAHRAFQLQHLVGSPDGVSHVTVWFGAALFRAFGLPEELPPG